MALSPTNHFSNWSSVSFASIAMTGIRNLSVDFSIQDIQEGADMDLGPTVAFTNWSNPTFTIQTNKPGNLTSLIGLYGVFTFVMNDARNQAAVGGGAIRFTTNALSYLGAAGIDGAFQQLTGGSFTVKTGWTDGVTNPVQTTSL